MAADNSECSTELGGSGQPASLTRAERITILLAEYAAREEEKIPLSNGALPAVSIAVAVVGGLFVLITQSGRGELWLLMPAAILSFVTVEANRHRIVHVHSRYIGLLERRINRIAGHDLLLWEHRGSPLDAYRSKMMLRHPKTGAMALNLSRVLASMWLLLAAAFLVVGAVQAALWLLAYYSWSPGARILGLALVVLFELVHVAWLAMIIHSRGPSESRLLDVIEAHWAADVGPEEPLRSD